MKNTVWWLLQGCIGHFLKIYLITRVLHGGWRNCPPNGACLFSAYIICIYSCCFSGVNVLARVGWVKEITQDPFPYNCCHHINGVSNIWELSEIYISICRHLTNVIVDRQSPLCLWLECHTSQQGPFLIRWLG